MPHLTSGIRNVATGDSALFNNDVRHRTSPPASRRSNSNTTGADNVATGASALLQ